jgi:hypothetical protein
MSKPKYPAMDKLKLDFPVLGGVIAGEPEGSW